MHPPDYLQLHSFVKSVININPFGQTPEATKKG